MRKLRKAQPPPPSASTGRSTGRAEVRWLTWLLLAGLCTTTQAADAGRLFRYRDERGVMHIDTNLPPGQAQAGYEVLDSRSLRTLNVIRPALSAEQRRMAVVADAAASKAEQARRREIVDQKNRDRMLLQTYANELELTRLRNSTLKSMDLILRTTENTVGHLRQNLAQMDQTIGEHKAAGRQPPASLVQARARTAADLADQEKAAVRARDEQNVLRARFDADLDRYRRLSEPSRQSAP